MKSRPWVALGFVILAALSFAVILVLAGIGGGLNRTSDGAYAPMQRGLSDQSQALLFGAYFAAGAFAAFTSKKEGRVLWAVAGHAAVFVIWFSEAFSSRAHGATAVAVAAIAVPFMIAPTILWALLLFRKEDRANQTALPTPL